MYKPRINPKTKRRLKNLFVIRLRFIYVLVATIILTYITTWIIKIPDPIINIEYFSLVILGIIFIVLICYIYDFIVVLRDLNLDECIAHDISILNYEKILLIDDIARNAGILIEEIREVHNNMKNEYNSLQFNMSATESLNLADFSFFIDEIQKTYSQEEINYHSYPATDIVDTELDFIIDFRIPIKLLPNETKTVKIQYRTKTFNKIFENAVEWMQIQINTITEKIHMEIQLNEEMKNLYNLIEPEELREDRTKYDMEIRDFSEQRMWISEDELKKESIKPVFKNDKIYWTVYRPKIGYKYRLFFKLKNISSL